MQVDEARAKALGWPKQKYAWIERERRWLCDALPAAMVVRAEHITDLYVTGTQLRLREAVPVGGGEPMRRLGRKADVDAFTRLLTSIYLSAEEFRLLAELPGKRLRKTRRTLAPMGGHAISVDTFEGPLAGLIMAEVEFDTDEAMAAFQPPPFTIGEVTEDIRFTGGVLAHEGLPLGRPAL